jgi:hypothetical protein
MELKVKISQVELKFRCESTLFLASRNVEVISPGVVLYYILGLLRCVSVICDVSS